MTQTSTENFLSFQPSQILCLEHEHACLYVEVIQFAPARQLCWVRPIVLTALGSVLQTDHPESGNLYDLRQSADLLWSANCFRLALDTEVIPLLTQLGSDKDRPEDSRTAHQLLQRFIRAVWESDNRPPAPIL